MNPHAPYSTGPLSVVRSVTNHRQLIRQLVAREVVGRYRGSIMGLAWSFLNPLLMLIIYTFVFSVVFKARWGTGGTEDRSEFALILFAGLIMHTLFSECVIRAPGVVLGNANYVKKVVFPLEILCWVSLGSALFHALVSCGVLLVAMVVIRHTMPWTVVLFPLVLIPFVLGVIGLSWALAAFGVFVRDIGQLMGMVTTILMFLTPIFYPVTSLPERFRVWVYLNPLTWVVEQARNTLIFGKVPSFHGWAISMILGALVAWGGFWLFQRLRRGFSDVI
ncbi:ABC-2 type transporter family protein [Paraburkholderia xenovorans LB400]|uniref:Transport permease protein n=1 Tax=Paraburkholderia xenovorans (strain LB400) TaxID=266265 RepID=Q144P0_PARXL|nr:ABC transporter permease [Paraburkholderia xenovorans]ABE29199.1 ABC O-antigen/lipopolysaccharide exporter, innermembrane subunit [Paraburkholderia xenovorans LB400]AIP30100.1 ABC-2 type transporter family protein [Paraburkholderia xenovorans LB400]